MTPGPDGDLRPAALRVDGPVVVLVPGLGLDDRAWARVREGLADGSSPAVRVVGLPTMGHPRRGRARLDVGAQAARLLADLGDDGAGVLLVGHSASCAVVVAAARRSSRVAGLVLVGPVTGPQGGSWPRLVGQWLRSAIHEKAWEAPELVPQYRRTGLRSMARSMARVRHYPTARAMRALRRPVVVVVGEQDRIGAWSTSMGDAARVTVVPGAGHMVPLTHPDAVVDAVRAVSRSVGEAGHEGSAPPRSRGGRSRGRRPPAPGGRRRRRAHR